MTAAYRILQIVKRLDRPGRLADDGRMSDPSISRLLLEAYRSFDSEIEAGLRDRGVSDLRPGLARTLVLIDRSGTHLGQLAQRAQITKQAMMQAVDELESLGCVRRTPDPGDGRAKVVRLTARGLRHRAAARKAVASVEARARRRLGDRRYEFFRVALEELSSEEE
jgi:DNA-binding MarR family transcriptional regulator